MTPSRPFSMVAAFSSSNSTAPSGMFKSSINSRTSGTSDMSVRPITMRLRPSMTAPDDTEIMSVAIAGSSRRYQSSRSSNAYCPCTTVKRVIANVAFVQGIHCGSRFTGLGRVLHVDQYVRGGRHHRNSSRRSRPRESSAACAARSSGVTTLPSSSVILSTASSR